MTRDEIVRAFDSLRVWQRGDKRAVHRLGFKAASTLNDAFEMAEDVVGRHPTITHLKNPPIVMADVK